MVGLGDAGRGRGLGGPLVNAGINRLVAEGASLVFLYVEADNEPALRAYQDVGFVVVEHHVCTHGAEMDLNRGYFRPAII